MDSGPYWYFDEKFGKRSINNLDLKGEIPPVREINFYSGD